MSKASKPVFIHVLLAAIPHIKGKTGMSRKISIKGNWKNLHAGYELSLLYVSSQNLVVYYHYCYIFQILC
jgi:hypothetical protein